MGYAENFMGPKPKPVVGASKGGMGVPGTQPKMGKTRPQATQVAKAADLGNGFTRAKKLARANANTKGKEVVPRAKIVTRAKPAAEY